MKKVLILTFLLLISFPASSQVTSQDVITHTGQTVFRVLNNTGYYLSCYYRDQYNYVAFQLPPYTTSMWYPVYGVYHWECR